MIDKTRIILALFATVLTGTAAAEITEDEAMLLGSDLTAWGAEKTGNKEGTIPPYIGQRPTPPDNFNPDEPGTLPDPYDDEVLFSITAENMDQYADNLTEGQKALFKKHPDYRMDIYQTRRTSAHLPHVLENTVKNTTSCKAVDYRQRIENCYGGFPFPIPKTGHEAMWEW